MGDNYLIDNPEYFRKLKEDLEKCFSSMSASMSSAIKLQNQSDNYPVAAGLTENARTWKSSHKDRMLALYETGMESDLTLLLGPQKESVKVHRLILTAGSPKLQQKLNNMSRSKLYDLMCSVLDSSCELNMTDFKRLQNLFGERDETAVSIPLAESELIIENVDSKSFKMLLKHLYTGDSGAEIENALQLLHIATDYKVQDLIEHCKQLLKGEITDENVLGLFEQAMEFAHTELIQSCLDYICKNATRIVQLERFADLRLECLIEIVKQDELQVESELELFKTLMKWGESECNRQNLESQNSQNMRKVLNKVLAYIRFSNMGQSEFALNVATKSILDEGELISLILCFMVPVEERSQLPSGRFISTSRNYITKSRKLNHTEVTSSKLCRGPQVFICRKDQSITTHQFNLGSTTRSFSNRHTKREELLLRFNTPVLLAGFKCMKKIFGIMESIQPGKFEYNYSAITINITVKDILGTCILQTSRAFDFEVLFDRPIKLDSNTTCKLEISFSGKLRYRRKGQYNPFHQFLLNESQYVLSVGTDYLNFIKFDVTNDSGKIDTVSCEFSRGVLDRSLLINEGFIKELIVYLY